MICTAAFVPVPWRHLFEQAKLTHFLCKGYLVYLEKLWEKSANSIWNTVLALVFASK
jgi:hypothetical protein